MTLLDGAGADEIHGEAGDDTIFGGAGNDRLFGDAGDDAIVGGLGHDWISGGTGNDGILGDDGPRRRARSPSFGGDDVIFGGLGDDVIDGRPATTRSPAPRRCESPTRPTRRRRRLRRRPLRLLAAVQPGRPAALRPARRRARRSPASRSSTSRGRTSAILVGGVDFFLNHDAANGPKSPVIACDGDDGSLGGLGNDWLTGGTGRDSLDGRRRRRRAQRRRRPDHRRRHEPDRSTPDPSYADVLRGGAGRDRFLTNNDGDQVARPRRRRHGDAAAGSPARSQPGSPQPLDGEPVPIADGRRRRSTSASPLNPALEQARARA